MKQKSLGIKNNLICIVIALVVFAIVTCYVMYFPNSRTYDLEMLKTVQGFLAFYPVGLAGAVSHFGASKFLFWPQFTAFCTVISHKKYAHAIGLVVFGQLAILCINVLKNFFCRERPCGLAHPGFSYPSGHALFTTCFYGMVIYLILHYVRNKFWKYFLATLIVIYYVLVITARMRLNVHFATDLLAGFCVGFILLNLYIISMKFFNE